MLKRGLEGLSSGGSMAEVSAMHQDVALVDTPKTKNRRLTPEELHQRWIDAGNELPDPERAHGKYERIELKSHQFVKLSQIRGDKNPISHDLKESIVSTGLVNGIDVALVTREQLAEYIAFTNRTWGADASIADFDTQCMPDGRFPLIIAGHTRHDMIDEAEQEGLMAQIPIEAKVHPIDGVEDVIELQSAENKHSQPKQERGAMATVESYYWGLEQGKWASPEEFIERYTGKNKLDLKDFKDALDFSYMPAGVRQFVLSGRVNYKGGIELGRSVKVVRKYVAFVNGYKGLDDPKLANPQSEDRLLLEKAVEETLMRKANELCVKKLNSTASTKHLEAWRGFMANALVKNPKQPGFEILTPDDSRRQVEQYMKGIRREIGQILGGISTMSAVEHAQLIDLNARVIGEDERVKLRGTIEASLTGQLKRLGGVAANSTEVSFGEDDDQAAMF